MKIPEEKKREKVTITEIHVQRKQKQKKIKEQLKKN